MITTTNKILLIFKLSFFIEIGKSRLLNYITSTPGRELHDLAKKVICHKPYQELADLSELAK